MEYADFDTLLAQSDVVTLHIPLLEGTRHIIGREELSKMKPGAILINTARGGLVDDNALAEAVLNGHLLGADWIVWKMKIYPKAPSKIWNT